MARLLFAQGWACSSPKFAQPQAVKSNPERAEAQSPAHLQGETGPPGWQGWAGKTSLKLFLHRDLPAGLFLSGHFRGSKPYSGQF